MNVKNKLIAIEYDEHGNVKKIFNVQNVDEKELLKLENESKKTLENEMLAKEKINKKLNLHDDKFDNVNESLKDIYNILAIQCGLKEDNGELIMILKKYVGEE